MSDERGDNSDRMQHFYRRTAGFMQLAAGTPVAHSFARKRAVFYTLAALFGLIGLYFVLF